MSRQLTFALSGQRHDGPFAEHTGPDGGDEQGGVAVLAAVVGGVLGGLGGG